MAEKKSIAKSIRLTPELFEFINKYNGNGFNEKFSNIIYYCFQTEKEMKKRIKQSQNELNRLNVELEKKRQILASLQQIEWAIDRATSIAEQLQSLDETATDQKTMVGQEKFF